MFQRKVGEGAADIDGKPGSSHGRRLTSWNEPGSHTESQPSGKSHKGTETLIARRWAQLSSQRRNCYSLFSIRLWLPGGLADAALAQPAHMIPAFICTAFFLIHGTTVLKLSRDFLLINTPIGSSVSFFAIPFSGYLSDRLGRKQVFIFGPAATGLFAFVYYALLDMALPALIVLTTLIAYFFHNLMFWISGSTDGRVLHSPPAV
jgi:hypothetical protein